MDFSVRKDVMQRFMKRLRMKIGVPVRYLLCGEYGEKRGRPHFHILLFGYAFPDRRPWRRIRAISCIGRQSSKRSGRKGMLRLAR